MPFKIHADFERILKGVWSDGRSSYLPILKNIRRIFFEVLLAKLYVLTIDLASQSFFTEEEMQLISLWKRFLRSSCRVTNKYFNKNLVMAAGDEKSFKSSNRCWIYGTLFAERDNKVGDLDHLTG